MNTVHQPGKHGFPRILAVDDETVTLMLISRIVEEAALADVVVCNDPRKVHGLMDDGHFDAVLVDLHMPWLDGRQILEDLSREHPSVPCIIMTSEDKLETAVACMREGAFDFLTKPLDPNRLIPALRHALAIKDLRREVQLLSAKSGPLPEPNNPASFAHIITASPVMRAVFAYIEAIAPSPRAVLIRGESGTGKELIARAIHDLSGRSGAFVPINVSGLDDTIFSDSLFGHVRGAYTGAETVRKGLVDQARDGTLFLDEIGDLEPSAQVKLLRLLQEGEYYPLGSDTPLRSRARVITATNADLLAKQETGQFRKDLYYRLISHTIVLPPLRERPEDIPLLSRHFIQDSASQLQRSAPMVSPALLRALQALELPGNVRELQAMIHDAVSRTLTPYLEAAAFPVLSGLDLGSFEGEQADSACPEPEGMPRDGFRHGPADLWVGSRLPSMKEVEDFLYTLALEQSGGRQQAAARVLGISQSTLSRWLREKQLAEPPPGEL